MGTACHVEMSVVSCAVPTAVAAIVTDLAFQKHENNADASYHILVYVKLHLAARSSCALHCLL